jgi:GDP-4-dehydro-6-deoxy-D-mannose reductase
MKVLITGASGFVGTHLTEYYTKHHAKEDLHCITFGGPGTLAKFIPDSQIYELDLLKKEKVVEIVKSVKPDIVIHLAALAAVGKSFKDPQMVLKNNILIAVNLLEAIRKYSKKAKVLLIGSADEYGLIAASEVPIKENTPLRPTSPYSVSKITVDFLGLQYFLAYKIKIIRLRPFNHIGEGQGLGFAVSDFAKQIIETEMKKRKEVRVGNLAAIRDFTDVKDIVEAYYLALKKCTPGEVYNVGSGKGVRMQDLLNILISKAKGDIRVEVDPKLYRPVDIESVVADSSKFQNTTGWKPSIPLDVTLERVLNYWRKRIKKENE